MYIAADKCRVRMLLMLLLVVAAAASMVVMHGAPTFSWLLNWASNLAGSVGLAATSVQAWLAYAELEATIVSGVKRYGRAYEELWRRADGILYYGMILRYDRLSGQLM